MTLFLEARPGPSQVTIVGAPLDITESFRSGAAAGPESIRALSQSLETFSPVLERDLTELGLGDMGDLALAGTTVDDSLRLIARGVANATDRGLVITLGGEHTVTLGAVRGCLRRFPDLAVIQVDAHCDLLQQYLGVHTSHATVLRRLRDVLDPKALLQIGIRSGTKEEFALAREHMLATPRLTLPSSIRRDLRDRPLYLSIDIDVLDPAFAPGTGYPEPGGPSFGELLDFMYSLSGLRVVAADVVEVLPEIDPAAITATAAAKLVREMALLFG